MQPPSGYNNGGYQYGAYYDNNNYRSPQAYGYQYDNRAQQADFYPNQQDLDQDKEYIEEDFPKLEAITSSSAPAAESASPFQREMKQSAKTTQQYVTAENLFDDSLQQGRIALAPAPKTWAAISSHGVKKGSLLSKDKYIRHQNGIFGSYCLEDVRCIAQLVLQKYPQTKLTYDCFNYETVSEITEDPKVIKSSTAPSQHITMYWENAMALRQQMVADKLSYHLHYATQHNDLLQKRKIEPKHAEDWSKFQRVFSQNMIFFNPYFNNAQGTSELIDAFFDYAQTNLLKDGVVTLMWNEAREDSLASIDIREIASKHLFRLDLRLNGDEFARKTGFRHLKNSTSLERAVSDCEGNNDPNANSVIVSAKRTDTIMMFRRQSQKREIPKENVIATTFASLSPVA